MQNTKSQNWRNAIQTNFVIPQLIFSAFEITKDVSEDFYKIIGYRSLSIKELMQRTHLSRTTIMNWVTGAEKFGVVSIERKVYSQDLRYEDVVSLTEKGKHKKIGIVIS